MRTFELARLPSWRKMGKALFYHPCKSHGLIEAFTVKTPVSRSSTPVLGVKLKRELVS